MVVVLTDCLTIFFHKLAAVNQLEKNFATGKKYRN